MAETHEGYFLIADITGYTRYLNESELAHAQETLTALLQLLVEQTRPPLVISRLAGDAVISYGLRQRFYQGQTLLEKVEDTYIAFRKAIERLVLNNTCRCNACANIANLDLKFIVHHGAFAIQRISDHDELVGKEVILLHRLLKNSVVEKTGIQAYALYSQSAIQALAVEGLTTSMTAHIERYEHLGQVQLWVQDMEPVWQARRDSVTLSLPPDQVASSNEVHINLPAEQVWDCLVQPQYRNFIIRADRMEIGNRQDGRVGPGSVYQCYHGDKMVPQTILEWQPFERMVTKELLPMAPEASVLVEYRLEDAPGGARLVRTVGRVEGPLRWRAFVHLLSPVFNRMMQTGIENFARQIEADYQRHEEEREPTAAPSAAQIQAAAAASLVGHQAN